MGNYFHKQLLMSKHIEITKKKLHKGVGILKKLCKYVQKETINNLFHPFLKSYTKYENLAWAGSPLELIKRSINCSIRTMMGTDEF